MREIPVSIITDAIEDMCITVCHELSDDMKACLYEAYENETSQIGKKILGQLKENLDIAESEMIPICQDTGMAVIFLKVGQIDSAPSGFPSLPVPEEAVPSLADVPLPAPPKAPFARLLMAAA